jgi:hypothetical protein
MITRGKGMSKQHCYFDFWPFMIDGQGNFIRMLTFREALARARSIKKSTVTYVLVNGEVKVKK